MKIEPIEYMITYLSEDETEAKYKISSVPRGVMEGLLNLIRQVSYQYAPGYAPIAFKLFGITDITDISNQYAETVREIASNIRNIYTKIPTDNQRADTPTKYILSYEGKVENELFAKDLKAYSLDNGNVRKPITVDILNPDKKILTVSEPQNVSLEILVIMGLGIIDAKDQFKPSEASLVQGAIEQYLKGDNVIRMNANFSPILSFSYKVIGTGDFQGHSTAEVTIKTNGGIAAKNILGMSSVIVNTMLQNLGESVYVKYQPTEYTPEEKQPMDYPIESLQLNPKEYNVLKKDYGYNSIREVITNVDKIPESIKESVKKALRSTGLVIHDKK